MRHVDPRELGTFSTHYSNPYDCGFHNDLFKFGYFNKSRSFKAVTMEEMEFDFSPKAGDKVCNRHRKNSEINLKQYDTNRNGNTENEIVYALWLARRDNITLPSNQGVVTYGNVTLEAYKSPVKQAKCVTFHGTKRDRSDTVVINIPGFGYDCTKSVEEWILEV